MTRFRMLAMGGAAVTVMAASLALPAGAADTKGPQPSLIPAERGVFVPTDDMGYFFREQPSLTSLGDGRVLVVSGYPIKETTAISDAATGTFHPSGSLGEARWAQTATLLQDGRVLVVGGTGSSGFVLSAEVWDPGTGSFDPAGSLRHARFKASATLLPDGRVLIHGGGDPEPPDEVLVTATDSFDLAETQVSRPDGVVLTDGRVLILDTRPAGHRKLDRPAIWDPKTGESTRAGSLVTPRNDYGYTATLLADGRVLLAGGEGPGASTEMLSSAEIWDPTTLTSTPTGSLGMARSRHSAVLLDDGRVLVVGANYRFPGASRSAEVFELRGP